MFSEDELGVARANGFGSHDLVSEGIGHHAALVDARLVSESVGSDDGLVGRAAKGDTLGEHLAGGVELAQDDVVGVEELVTANHEGGGDLFKGGVAGAFADAIDGALDLAGAAFDAGQGVGNGHTEVVVAVSREDYVVDSRDASLDQAEERGVLLGGGEADGVGDVDGGGPGLDGDGDHLEKELGVGSRAVLSGELDVFCEGGARRTDSAAWSRAWSRVRRSLYSRWRSEEAMTRWMRLEGAASTARAAASMSSRLQRASEATRGPRTSRATAWIAAKSPSEAMANPASRTSTPSAAIWWAKRSFSSWCMVQPGDCSPSRRVVSKKTIWFWFGLGIEFDPRFGRYSMVLGVAGEHAAYSKYGQPFKHSALVLDQDDDYKWP